MTKHKRLIQTLILSAVLVCGICIGAGASGTSQKITATLEAGITVTVDGVPQQFLDVDGNRVYPIAYNGSTYLPLRAVCQDLAGYKVGWDQATRTVSVATKEVDGADLLDMQRAYNLAGDAHHYMSSDKKTTEVNGYTLSHWVDCNGWYDEGNYSEASFNIEGKYDTVTFRYYSDQDTVLYVLGDNGAVLWQKDLTGGDLYQEVTVDLLRTNQLSFRFEFKTGNRTHCYIYDTRLK